MGRGGLEMVREGCKESRKVVPTGEEVHELFSHSGIDLPVFSSRPQGL